MIVYQSPQGKGKNRGDKKLELNMPLYYYFKNFIQKSCFNHPLQIYASGKHKKIP
jgi:hypothetical protein